MIEVETAEEMLAAVEREIGGQDMLIMAAAVAAFQPAEAAQQKIKRTGEPGSIKLKAVPDILKTIRKGYKGTVVAFALQAGDELEPAREKLREKGADYVMVNRYDEPGAGFETETNHVWVIPAEGEELEIGPESKSGVAYKILARIAQDMHP